MKLAVKMLQNMGFQPQSAYNGAEAVELVVDKSMHFDLVFMGQSTQRNTNQQEPPRTVHANKLRPACSTSRLMSHLFRCCCLPGLCYLFRYDHAREGRSGCE